MRILWTNEVFEPHHKEMKSVVPLLLTFFLFSPLAQAGQPKFHCYSAPNIPVQGFEYASGNCGGKSKTAKAIGENGQHDILCLYSAVCKPVPEKSPAEPPKRTIPELFAGQASGELKPSMVVCRGTGEIVDGKVNTSTCPSPSKCRSDVFYNFAPVGFPPANPEGVSAPEATSANEKGAAQ